MRNPLDRRQADTHIINAVGDDRPTPVATERRKSPDRRINNLSMEERQMLFSEMPAPHPEPRK